MEYAIVRVPGHEGEKITVIVNGQPNGKTGELLSLSQGWTFFSVELPGAATTKVELKDTTSSNPANVEVPIGAGS